jgi:hypothetical protein
LDGATHNRDSAFEILGMVVCPYDCHWCDLPDCRTGTCELAAEPALVPCMECGVLIIAPGAVQMCIDCVAFAVPGRLEAN